MANLFGKRWTRKQLLERIGDPSQIAAARPYKLTDGKAKDVAGVDFSTGSGFRFTVLPDRGMDISTADYCGRSLCWRSATGEVSPNFYQPEGIEWLHNFFGGLVTTCGLSYFGAPCEDEGRSLGLHGRVSNIPAKEVSVESGWEGDDYVIGIRGKVAESSVFGPNLCMTRWIFAFLGQNRLFIHDEVANEGQEPAPHMMLYHINVGFPALDTGSRLIAPSLRVTPRDPTAERGCADYAQFPAPTFGFKEQVFYHELAASKGRTMVALANPTLGFGTYVAFSVTQLPTFVQWKMAGKGTYVCGLEPATNTVEGRAKARAEGQLRTLKPGETATYDLEIGTLTSPEEIAACEAATRRLMGKRRTRLEVTRRR